MFAQRNFVNAKMTVLNFLVLFLVGNNLYGQTIENSYNVNQQIPIGGSGLYYVQISGAPSNAVITNVEAKFGYIAYGVVQNYVSCRFNRGSDPGSSGGLSLVSQGSLPAGNPGTYGYVPFSNWNGQSVNTNYYFRFNVASGSPYTATINTIYVRVTYALPPNPPSLISPADYSIYNRNNTTSITFQWTSVSGALEYWLNVFPSGSSSTPVFNGSVGNTTSYSLNPSGWNNNVYIWQVKVRTSGGWSSYSSQRQFIADKPPVPPLLSSPDNNTGLNIGTTQNFNWSAPPPPDNAARYTFRIVSGTNINNAAIIAEELTSASRSVTFSSPTWTPGTYTWGVRAIKQTPAGYNQSVYEQTIGWGGYATRSFNIFDNATGFILPVIDDNPNDNLIWDVPFNYFGHYYGAMGGFHPGEDWNLVGGDPNADLGKPVYAIGNGTVAKVSNLGSLGYLVALRHTGTFMIPGKSATENGQRYSYNTEVVTSIYSVYMHINNVTIKEGAPVQKGVTVLGYIMNPGGGPHLHFEIRHPNTVNSNNWSLVGSSSNWAIVNGSYTGYYLNLQEMVNAGVRHPREFIAANSATVATPTFSPLPGIYASSRNVSLSCATSGATIRYTTNGSDPTESSPAYTSPIPVNTTMTIKARGYLTGWMPSNVATGLYVICSYSISPTSRSHGSGVETGTVSVTASNGCGWMASSNASWITITSGSSGSGNGTVSYSVATNTNANSRTGTLTIAGQTFTVTQAGISCTYSISPTSRSHGSGAETGIVSVTAASGCNWAAGSNASWITITSGSNGSGNGTVSYSLTANSSTSSRTGILTIAGQTFTVTQAGSVATIFFDNFENGINGWAWISPWAQTTTSSYSPTHSWTDSPGGNYDNNRNVSILSPAINLSGYSSATLTFWHRYDLESGFDFGSVWITTNNGASYTFLKSFTSTQLSWTQSTLSLNAFVGNPSVKIVFQLYSDGSITRDGWYIDDVKITSGGSTSSLPRAASLSESSHLPKSFSLSDNYPNPFNPSTTIRYTIPTMTESALTIPEPNAEGKSNESCDCKSQSVHVTLRVFNIMGQVVRSLVDENKKPGFYEVHWDGKNDAGEKVGSGVYIYALVAGNFKATKRMTILK